jgi:hypothetical protein
MGLGATRVNLLKKIVVDGCAFFRKKYTFALALKKGTFLNQVFD